MKSKLFAFYILAILLVFQVPLGAQENEVTIKAPALRKTEEGLVGVISYITVSVREGEGHIYIDTWPLTEIDMQGSVRLAANVACELTEKRVSDYDFFITFRSDASVIGGPSAGASITVALIAALEGLSLSEDVMMTGMINPDGSVGPVGGILEKVKVASEVGMKKFLIPEGQEIITVQKTLKQQIGSLTLITSEPLSVNVISYSRENLGLNVKEVYDIGEAVFQFTGKRLRRFPVSEVYVDTEFLREHSEREFNKTKKLLEDVRKDFESYEGRYRYELSQILDEATLELSESEKNFNSEKNYLSLNNALDAKGKLYFLRDFMEFIKGWRKKEIQNQINEISSNLEEERKRIYQEEKNMKTTNLESFASAINEIENATHELESAIKSLEDEEYFDALYHISHAKILREFATLWLEFSRNSKGGEKLTESEVRYASETIIENAELTLVYTSSLLGENDLITQSSELISSAKEKYKDGEYASSLLDALKARVIASLAIEVLSTGEEVMKERLSRSKQAAGIAIEISRENGIEPYHALSYYELAEDSEERGEIIEAIARYNYAKEVALIFRYLRGTMELIENVEVPIEEKVDDEKVEKKILLYPIILSFILGVLFGFILKKRF
ncbi:MAG: S16 family serine protease [Candidatus Methanofastidiosia archaeon]